MKTQMIRRFYPWIFQVLVIICISACQSRTNIEIAGIEGNELAEVETATEVVVNEIKELQVTVVHEPILVDSVAIDATIPVELTNMLQQTGVEQSPSQVESITLMQKGNSDNTHLILKELSWVYVLAAPFPTVTDGLTIDQILYLWGAEGEEDVPFQKIMVDPITYEIFTQQWGQAGRRVIVVSAEKLVENVWNSEDTLSIIGFEDLVPEMKVIKLDGLSPFDSDFESKDYPLTVEFEFTYAGNPDDFVLQPDLALMLTDLPESNYERDKVTSVMLTGVTALVRETAARIERNGIEYPSSDIQFLFDEMDILHISNEVSFYSDCPPADPPRKGGRFCSSPDYVSLFTNIGVDIVELTGNHLLDYGQDAFLETLQLYDENEMDYYGGGIDQNTAKEALLVEVNGNSLAFIGCNVPGPESVFATENSPGAAQCDIDAVVEKISLLREQGYNVIVTVQHYESCQLQPMSGQRVDFQRLAEAGAVIVSGSQAHCPQGMQFVDGAFVHYGLGNLFFDQMYTGYRNEFLDEHIFYKGKYLGVVLHTAVLEDYSKPRIMTTEERMEFLEKVFGSITW